MAKAKREALERAGTYIESLTVVKDHVVEKDEILALTAGVLKAVIVSQKNYATEDAFGVVVVARVDVDTSVLEERVKKLLQDRTLLTKLQESQDREKELLKRITLLEKQNQKLTESSSDERRERIKEQFREASRKLAATELNKKALALWDLGFFSDVDKAIEHLNQAIMLDSDYAGAYHSLGLVYSTRGDYDRSIEYYNPGLFRKVSKKRLEKPTTI
jgi:tetratricopeptide (TPR) repeat protein